MAVIPKMRLAFDPIAPHLPNGIVAKTALRA
jgi:hypothetical protein